MANQLLTLPVIAKRALANLYNSTVFAGLVFRDYDPEFNGKVGDTIMVRKPAVFTAHDYDRGTGIIVQNANETDFAVKLDTLVDVSFAVTSEDMTLKIDDFAERLLVPAMEAINQKVDGDLAAAALAAAADGGTPKSPLTAVAATDVITVQGHNLRDGERVVFPTLTGGTGLVAGTTVYYVRDSTPDTFKVSATDGGAAVNITADATAGSVAEAGGGVVTRGGGDPTNALIDARTALTKFKAPTVNRVAVVSPEQAGSLLKDPLMHNANQRGDTDGLIEASLGRKFGLDTYETQALSGLDEGVAFHRDSLALVTRTLEIPMSKQSNGAAAVENYKGLGLRIVKDYDQDQKQEVISVDFLYGIESVRPSWSVELDLS